MKDFFQKFTPLQIAGATFLILLLSTLAARYIRQRDIRAADYDVVYQARKLKRADSGNNLPQAKAEAFQRKLAEEPNFRYGERLREASALVVSLTVSEYFDRLKTKRIEHTNLRLIIQAAQEKNLLPAEFQFSYTGLTQSTAVTENGVYYLRYLVNPYALEIVSVGKQGFSDGEIFILRVPDAGRLKRKSTEEAELSSASLWVAPLSNAYLPPPFAAASVYEQSGWTQEVIQINDNQK